MNLLSSVTCQLSVVSCQRSGGQVVYGPRSGGSP